MPRKCIKCNNIFYIEYLYKQHKCGNCKKINQYTETNIAL